MTKITDKLTSEQVIEKARLEALQELQQSEDAAAADFAQQLSAKSANAVIAEHAEWVKQLKEKAAELFTLINQAPNTDTLYTLVLGASKHLEAINVASVPNFYTDAVNLKHALDKTIDRVTGPARVVASIRNARVNLRMTTPASPAPVLL